MTISEFLSDHIREIVLRIFFASAAALFLLASGTQAGIVILLGIFWVLVFFGMQMVEFLRCRSSLQKLENIMDELDKKYLFAECAPKGRNAYERRMLELLRRAGRAMTGAVSDAEASCREYREYVESWVHEIKAPITAAGLIGQNFALGINGWKGNQSIDSQNAGGKVDGQNTREKADGRNAEAEADGQKVESEADGWSAAQRRYLKNAAAELRRKLSLELAQIEAHVERALFYARAENPEKDFLLRRVRLDEAAAQAIGQYRALLLENGVRVETENLEQIVFTDSKWLLFILGQLLQNAVRYRKERPAVILKAVRLEKQAQLTVKDNGIGIPAHELPRVFERGFTGSNGRTRGQATGMGLYLCKKLADVLEIDLQIASEIGEGTAVTLTFPAEQNNLHEDT